MRHSLSAITGPAGLGREGKRRASDNALALYLRKPAGFPANMRPAIATTRTGILNGDFAFPIIDDHIHTLMRRVAQLKQFAPVIEADRFDPSVSVAHAQLPIASFQAIEHRERGTRPKASPANTDAKDEAAQARFHYWFHPDHQMYSTFTRSRGKMRFIP